MFARRVATQRLQKQLLKHFSTAAAAKPVDPVPRGTWSFNRLPHRDYAPEVSAWEYQALAPKAPLQSQSPPFYQKIVVALVVFPLGATAGKILILDNDLADELQKQKQSI